MFRSPNFSIIPISIRLNTFIVSDIFWSPLEISIENPQFPGDFFPRKAPRPHLPHPRAPHPPALEPPPSLRTPALHPLPQRKPLDLRVSADLVATIFADDSINAGSITSYTHHLSGSSHLLGQWKFSGETSPETSTSQLDIILPTQGVNIKHLDFRLKKWTCPILDQW